MRPARDADVFDAVAHPVRRRILMSLRDGAQPAGELARPFAISLPAVAQHLAVLRDAELVTTTRHGKHVIYVLNPRPLRALFEWAEAFATLWNRKLDALEAYLDAHPDGVTPPRRPAAKRTPRARRPR